MAKTTGLKDKQEWEKCTMMTDEENKEFKKKFASAKTLKQDAARKKNLAAQINQKCMFVANFNLKKTSDASVLIDDGNGSDC